MNRHSSNIKKEKIIDLTDIGRNNIMPVVRELRSMSDPPAGSHLSGNTITFAVDEDKGLGLPGPELQDPDGNFEEQLEASGATIIKSETYYPASRTTITKRSMTPEEHAAQREQYYLER